ncbi:MULTISPECIES: HEAT repeat domain-containing protein [unclassified Janthinobacterium]|uniref:HEAT repeat domain-containing protein n=1 Tax=unclassified Janthinobacterium TaxID=2610881 RepID=UPI001E4E0E68|nr:MULTISPECIES: HEAT repeat domain-containing protein [unclassified Janthinobacterium]MCC7644002.1 HEAT repeat domain-containing protein [Janthinobacterium sp. EB271-G4-3-1]MCC7692095.1 HEAT repeat domain-containing protein [Janthinobacterium sp. EB271-G4-3-2]
MSRGVADIAPARLALLNGGSVASATLTEGLAIDFTELLAAAVPGVGADRLEQMRALAADGITRRMALAAQLLLDAKADLAMLQAHPSDTVRGWACFAIAAQAGWSLPQRLAAMRPLADDGHFGVREWAWLALRPHLAASLDEAIALLAPWTADPSERVRRFACEALRPRGVWCAHIARLKAQPQLALPVLQALRADPAVYVQDSVANWLNDAAKSQPDWVRSLCAQWLQESPAAATKRICKRAQRSLS